MTPYRARAVALGVAMASLVLAHAPAARAGNVEVSPVRLELPHKVKSGLFTLRNQSAEGARFQVSAYAWAQTPAGEMTLTPTQDVVFFPAMLSIPAGGAAKIRVGTAMPAGAVEKSYRIVVEELPPLTTGPPGTVRVLTRLVMPVFFEPLVPNAVPAVTGLALQGSTISFSVQERGNAHFMARSTRVIGKDAAGATLFESSAPSWYVLAGGVRDYKVPLPALACGKLASLLVYVDTEQTTVHAAIRTGPATCP